MPDNELLIEKWETQRRMAEEAGYSIKKMLDNADKVVAEMVKEGLINPKYATRKPSRIKSKIFGRTAGTQYPFQKGPDPSETKDRS